ncbi:hypothetical protein JCM8547_006909 [Rhodosporidiobolus lusitaniae]
MSGSSTDYDSLPTPLRLSSLNNSKFRPGRGRGGGGGGVRRRYGKRAQRVVPPAAVPPSLPAAAGEGGKGGSGARPERERARAVETRSSTYSDEGEAPNRIKASRKGGRGQAGRKSRAEHEANEEEVEEEREGKTSKTGKELKRPSAKPAASSSSFLLPPNPLLPSATNSAHPPQAPSVSLEASAKPARRTRSAVSSTSATPAEQTDLDPFRRASKKPRALSPHAAQPSFPPTPPQPRSARGHGQGEQQKIHPAVFAARLEDDLEAQLTPPPRARALKDKSNRRSLAGSVSNLSRPSLAGGSGRNLSRPSLPGSPRTTSRRNSVVDSPARLSVFRDPSPAPPASIGGPSLTDLPARRRPLPRAHSSTSLLSAPRRPSLVSQSAPPVSNAAQQPLPSDFLPLPRSPSSFSSSAVAPQQSRPRMPRALTASPRLPPLRRPSALSHGGTSLAVPGAGSGGGEGPRLPPPWALVTPAGGTSSSVRSDESIGAGAGGDEREGGRPVFRFTTTQFADLPSVVLATRGGEGGAEEDTIMSLRVGMESSFMLEEWQEEVEGAEGGEEGEDYGGGMEEMRWADETVSKEEEKEETVEEEEAREKEGEEGEEREMEVDVAPTEIEAHENDVNLEDGGIIEEADETLQLDPTVGKVQQDDSPVLLAVNSASPPAPSLDLPSPTPTSAPSALIPLSPSLFTAAFMPPRRPRPALPSPSPSGPPSSEDDLAYYLRTTGTYSSEDDLPLSPSSALNSSEEENRLGELEIGRAVKPSSNQRLKRIKASEEARKAREGVRGLRIGEGKEGRRRGWERVILSPVKGWRPVRAVRVRKEGGGKEKEGYEAEGEEEGDEEEDELAL